MKKKKIVLGDIFAINTPKGEAYLQYVYKDGSVGEMIRVLPGLFIDRPNDLKKIVEQKNFSFFSSQ